MMPLSPITRAAGLACVLLALAPVLASGATPSPTSTPSVATKCVIPQGLEADPTEQALQKQCLAQASQIQDQKNKLSNNLSLAQGSATNLQEMLAQTRQAVSDNEAKQEQIKKDIHDLEVRQDDVRRQMEDTKKRLAQRRTAYSDFIRRSYEHQPNMWAYLLDSRGISDFVGRLAALVQIRNFGLDLIRSIRDDRARLTHQQDQLNSDHQTAIKKQDDLVKAQQDLINAEVKVSAILGALNASIASGQNEMANADSQSAALVAQIVAAEIAREDALIQAANDAAWAAAQAWLASNSASYQNSSGHSRLYPMIWPAQGIISQGFGPTDFTAEPPAFGAAHFHAGVDVANSAGTPILAADDGVVVAAETSMLGNQTIGYGRHVIIAHHNGLMTLYGHLDGYIVRPGDHVTQGQLIGVMGSTGMSTGPHLHFEVRLNSTPVNPLPYLPPNGPNTFRG